MAGGHSYIRIDDARPGEFEIHHLAPGLFGGYEGTEAAGYIATPEKALFDSVYVRATSRGAAYFPDSRFRRTSMKVSRRGGSLGSKVRG
jgi:hypothetical protein